MKYKAHVLYGKYSTDELVDIYGHLVKLRKRSNGRDVEGIRWELKRRKGMLEEPTSRGGLQFGGLTARQEKFCLEYMRTGDMAEAYKKAGYKSFRHRNATALLRTPKIQARIDEIREATIDKIKFNANKVLERFSEIYDKSLEENDFANANRAMEFVGKHLGMLIDRSEQKIRHGALDSGSDEASIKKDIDKLADIAGLKLITGGKP
jgi:hypothetical protein